MGKDILRWKDFEIKKYPQDRIADAGESKDKDYEGSEPELNLRELERIHFQMLNDRVVDEVTHEILYKPHTLTLLLIIAAALMYLAFNGVDRGTETNAYYGFYATLAIFLVISVLAFPNGPFIRPHPLLWRMTFGLCVAYICFLQFALFQEYEDIKKVMTWLDPVGLSKTELPMKLYAVNCSDYSPSKLWSHCDYFVVGHFTGWVMKAMMLRHGVLCWFISISWEITEVIFHFLLPNFEECWWDSLFLDILLCNGVGIWVGLRICRYFNITEFKWESVKQRDAPNGGVKRVVLHSSNRDSICNAWFNINILKRTFAIYVFVIIWLISELNTFFLKHVLSVDTKHPIVFWRLIFISLITAPSIKQYYLYATDPLVKRLGVQCWVSFAVVAYEAAVSIKFGKRMFSADQIPTGLIACFVLALIFGAYLTVIISIWWAKKIDETETLKNENGESHRYYIDSSFENLGAIHKDVSKRRKTLGLSGF